MRCKHAAAAVLLLMMFPALFISAQAATIVDCIHPRGVTEKTICAHEELRKTDEELGILETRLEGLLPKEDTMARRELSTGRYRFTKFLRMCGRDIACLKKAYEHRLKQIRAWLAKVEKK